MSAVLTNVDEVRTNLKRIQKNLECPICLELLSDPYTTHCSHPFCRTCIYTVILSNKHAKCPLCKEPISKRSMNENTRLGEIVEAVKDLEQAIIKDTGITKTPPRVVGTHSHEACGTPGPGLIMHSLLHPTPQKHCPNLLSSKHGFKDSETVITANESPGSTSAGFIVSPTSSDPPSTSPGPPSCPPSTSSSEPVIKRKRKVRFASNKSTRRSTRLKGKSSVQSTMTSEHRKALLDAIENVDFDLNVGQTNTPQTDKQVKQEPPTHDNADTAVSKVTCTHIDEVPLSSAVKRLSTNVDACAENNEHINNGAVGSCVTPLQNHTPHKQPSREESHTSTHDVEIPLLTNTTMTTVLETPFIGVSGVQHNEQDHSTSSNDDVTAILAEETQAVLTASSQPTTQTVCPTQYVAETQFTASPDVAALSLTSDNGPSESLKEGGVKSCDDHVISPTNTATQTVVIKETQLTKLPTPSPKDTPQTDLQSLPGTNTDEGNMTSSSIGPHSLLSPTATDNESSPVIPLQNGTTVQPTSEKKSGINVLTAGISAACKSPSGSLAHSSAHSSMVDIVPSSQPSPAHQPLDTVRTCLPHLRNQFTKKLSTYTQQHTQNTTTQNSLAYSQDVSTQELQALKLQAEEKEKEIKELEAAILAAKKRQETSNDGETTVDMNFDPCLSDVDTGSDKLSETFKRGCVSPDQIKPASDCVCVVPSSLDCTTTVIAETAPENLTPPCSTHIETETSMQQCTDEEIIPSTNAIENGHIDSSDKMIDVPSTMDDSLLKDNEHGTSNHLTVSSSSKKKKNKRRSSTNGSNGRKSRSKQSIDSQNDSNSIEETKILSIKKTTRQLSTSETSNPLIKEADSLLRQLRAPPKAVLEERSKMEIDDALFDGTTRISSSSKGGMRNGCAYHTRSQSKRKSKTMTSLVLTGTSGTSGSDHQDNRKRRTSSTTPTDSRLTKKQRLSSSEPPSKKPRHLNLHSKMKTSSTIREELQTTPTSSVQRIKATIVETPAIRLSGLIRGDSPTTTTINSTVSKNSNKKKQPLSFVGSGLTRIQLRQAQLLAKRHGGRIASCFNGSTTHVLVLVDENGLSPRTVKYLSGVAAGKWVVQYQWIEDSLIAGCLLPEDHYEVRGDRVVSISDAPKLARQKRSNGEPGLFAGCAFVLLGNYGNLTPDQLSQLIQLGHGIVLSSMDDVTRCNNDTQVIIVCDDNDDHMIRSTSIVQFVRVSSTWVLDTLSKYSWQPPLTSAS